MQSELKAMVEESFYEVNLGTPILAYTLEQKNVLEKVF